jgi:hypothetical protein
VRLAQNDFARAKRTYVRIAKALWSGKAAAADVLAALGTNAAGTLAYHTQLKASLEAQLPGSTTIAGLPPTPKVTIAPDGTAKLA